LALFLLLVCVAVHVTESFNRRGQSEPLGRIALVQPKIAQEIKWDPARVPGILDTLRRTTVEAAAGRPGLILWPEAVTPLAVRGEESARRWVEELVREVGVPLVLGSVAVENPGRPQEAWFNGAFVVTPESGLAPSYYAKRRLVPFGEYVPLGEWLPFMRRFTPYEQGYECKPGEHWTRFKLTARDGRKFTFGCLICYEDSDPYLARQYVASEPVDFLVNISNDGWFKGTEEHEQHLAICRFRAVEARRAVVRGVNMGVSGLIDPDGRVTALPNPEWSKSKKVDAVVTATVPVDARAPLYARLGDWVPAGCWLAALLGAGVGRVRRPALGARAA
ncbi:MAG: apolipoprotein N-acyltransferase, partial [Gemmata sp.]